MFKKVCTLGTIFLVGVLHLPAVLNDWYFYFWWYDVMMHALGGVAMGCLAYVFWDFLAKKLPATGRTFLLQGLCILGFVALIGIGWEWAEGLADALVLPKLSMTNAQLGLVDTMLDLYFDLFGGLCAWLLLYSCERTRKKNHT